MTKENGRKGFWFLWFLPPTNLPPLTKNNFAKKSSAEKKGIPLSPLTGNSVASIFPFLCPIHLLISLVTLVSLVSWVSRVSLVSLVSVQVLFSQNTILKRTSCLDLGVNYLKPAFLLHQKLNT